MKKLAISVILACLIIRNAAAAGTVYIDFDGTPGLTPLSMTFHEDIYFPVFKNVTTTFLTFSVSGMSNSDNQENQIHSFSSQLEVSINNGERFNISGWADYSNFYTDLGSYIVAENDIITLYAGTLTSSEIGSADFNVGNDDFYYISVLDDKGAPISVVPEPASGMMLIFGAGVSLAIYHIRRCTNR